MGYEHQAWVKDAAKSMGNGPRRNYTYRFRIRDQEGTLWWHAHTGFLRARATADFARLPLNPSVAYTTNGQPGDLYRCSSQGVKIITQNCSNRSWGDNYVENHQQCTQSRTFLLHCQPQMTVVGKDAAYTKPFRTTVLVIGPVQTFNVLVTADQPQEYRSTRRSNQSRSRPVLPALPAFNDTATATAFTARIWGLTRVKVFTKVDVNLYFIVGLGLINCTNPNSRQCQAPNGTRFTASMNNVSFELPRTTSLMQAYYERIPSVFTTDFSPVPPVQFDYTGNVPRGLWPPSRGTKLYKVKYGSRMQIVLQDTSIATTEEHPMHVHGFPFFVWAPDPLKFNLVDPPVKNTIGTPPGGWVAIRFVADNPGNMLNLVHPLPHRLTSEFGFGHGTSGRKWSRPFPVINTSTARSTPMLRLRKHR
ncbi:hypothetical protein V8G54_017998 [Vigna mungo]|uniref:Laccase n=1 Tax=Vigna mungo TaxID=3915 RepID=A0AAQ3RSA1_VIGMU